MSSHFKYEIDERNIRLRLKEKEVAFTEEAWQRYESYSTMLKSQGPEGLLHRVHITVNRNVVLPAVFGAVIVLFSLLLFNFINIKNPAQSASAEPMPEPVPQQEEPQAKATIALPAVTVKQPEEEPAASATLAAEALAQPASVALSDRTSEEPSTRQAGPAEPQASEASPERRSDTNAATLGDQPRQEHSPVIRKKRRQREMVVTEPTAEEAELAPPPAETNPQ